MSVYGPTGTTPTELQLGPAVGEVLAELALRGETPRPIAAFRADRFDIKAEGP